MTHLARAHYTTSQKVRDHIGSTYGVAYSRAGIIAFFEGSRFYASKNDPWLTCCCETVQQDTIAAYGALKEALPTDDVIVHVDGVHPTHRPKRARPKRARFGSNKAKNCMFPAIRDVAVSIFTAL